MYDILIYPNITFQKNLEKDSYVVVLNNVIKELNKIRNDLNFTILSPKIIESLVFPNTKQLILPLPSYPSQMRTHFDSKLILDLIDCKNNSYDVVWSHLPEHTLQLKNLFFNLTNEQPIFIGYSHWFEVKENTNYAENMLPVNLHGILAMEKCMVNTLWLKNLIVKRAEKYLSKELVEQLEEKVITGYLGTDEHDIMPKTPKEKVLVFNHRDNGYTGFRKLITVLDKLYEQRQDFKLLTTLINLDRPYAKTVNITNRETYLKALSECYAGIGYFQNYSAWSISTTDGLSVGVPYLLPNAYCYPEMLGKDYPLLFDDEKDFLSKLNSLLDDTDLREKLSKEVFETSKNFLWKKRTDAFNNLINEAIAKLPILRKETDSYHKLVKIIESDKSITKKYLLKKMNWGINIGWNRYKNMLRKNGIELNKTQTALF